MSNAGARVVSGLEEGVDVDEFIIDESGAPGEVLSIGGAAAFEVAVDGFPIGEESIDVSLEVSGAGVVVNESMDALGAFDEGGGGSGGFSAPCGSFCVEPLSDIEVKLVGEVFKRGGDGLQAGVIDDGVGGAKVEFAAQ